MCVVAIDVYITGPLYDWRLTGGMCVRLKEDVKAVFHFNRKVAKRSVFHCFVSTQA